jgi:hypothetical protein
MKGLHPARLYGKSELLTQHGPGRKRARCQGIFDDSA